MSGLASELKRNQESITRVKREREKVGDKYTVGIRVDPERRHKLGRRATLSEAYLGIVPKVDDQKVIVGGFVPDGEAFRKKEIRVGDWLMSVDDKEVDGRTLNGVLAEFVGPTVVS